MPLDLTRAEVFAIYESLPEGREFGGLGIFTLCAFSDMRDEVAAESVWCNLEEQGVPHKGVAEELEDEFEAEYLDELMKLRQKIAKVWRALRRAGVTRLHILQAYDPDVECDDEPTYRELLLARRALEERGILPRLMRLAPHSTGRAELR